MRKHVKPVLWITAAVAASLGLLVVFLLAAPFLINLEPVKDEVVAQFSKTIGGTIEARRIDISLFPRPSVVLRGGEISIREGISGTFSALSVYPEVRAFFRGKARISELVIEGANAEMGLPQSANMAALKQLSPKVLAGVLSSFVAKASSAAPGVVVSIRRGSLSLLLGNKPSFRLKEIDGRAGLKGDRLEVEIACTSNVWNRASFTGWFTPAGQRGQASLRLTELQLDSIARNFVPLAEPRLEDAPANLELEFGMDGSGLLRTGFKGDMPKATLRKGSQTLALKKVALKGELRRDGEKTAISLTRLDSAYPELNVSGSLLSDPASSRASLSLHSGEVHVESLAKPALFLCGHLHAVRSTFEILKRGRVTGLTVASLGRSISDLARTENVVVQGTIAGGSISLPESGIDLEGVKGKATISRGVIEGKDLEARLGNTQGTKGMLRLDLKGEPVPFHLDVAVRADLAELPPYLKRFVQNEPFLKELDLIEGVTGDASGQLVLEGRPGGMEVGMDVKAFDLHALYGRFPYPLEVRGGFSYDERGASIMVQDISVQAGRSAFSRLSGQVRLGKEPHLNVTSGAGTLRVDEIYPWLLSFESTKGVLGKIGSAKGVVTFDTLYAEGPLFLPESWRFRAGGRVEDIVVASKRLPAPLEVRGGSFEAGPEQFSLSEAIVRFQDASLTVSGVLDRYLEGPERVDLSFRGEMGKASAEKVFELVHLPQDLRVRPPFSLSRGHLAWRQNGGVSLSADVGVSRGPEISLDALSEREELVISRLSIRDAKSNASLSFHLKGRVLDLTFNGSLTGSTVDELFEINDVLSGWIKGDLSAHIELDRPLGSVAHGMLHGAGMSYPWAAEGPVQITTFSLDAQDNRFTLDSSFLALGHSLRAKGKVGFQPDGFSLDMDLFVNGFDLGRVMAKPFGRQGEETFWSLPLKGTLRVESDYVSYGRFTWRPVRAELGLGRDSLGLRITKADLCAIDIMGLAKVSPRGIDFRFTPKAKNQDMRKTLICLSDFTDIVSGQFSLDGDVSGNGKAEALAESFNGTVQFEAKNGRIDRYGLVSKVFSILSPTGILRIPDLTKQGFSYHTVKATGELRDGKIAVSEGLMDAPSTDLIFSGEIDLIGRKIDATVLVVPFKTLDRIISFIPLVRYVLAGRLVAIPVRVTGDLDDPKVTPFSPSAVGAGLLDTVKRALHLPFKLIQPLLPGEEKSGGSS